MNLDLKKMIAGLSTERRAELSNALAPASDPIAVIGIGCRFPGGADTPDKFWQLLQEGRDTVTEVPADRWPIDEYFDADPSVPGKMSTRWGAFLDRVDQFDASFFGISPREAARMDPQQRLLLEVCWEALENAGQSEASMSGSTTGVFGGICATDYWFLQAGDVKQFDGYAGLGGCHSIAVGRLSYLLDLRGSSVAVDTACSSSLVAVHLACQSLRTRECNMAVAGGVNLMVAPHATVFLSKWGMMAPDGRCKTFDSKANGIVRGEGCGFVVLKRLSDALADGDQISAVIRGTATSQDGRGTRLSAPNGRAQQVVVRRALDLAGVAPDQISFVETHGTGTPIGDPIEIEALTEVIGHPRAPGLRCALGSVKTNMGHLEAAAGVAGLIKAVLCLKHGSIPRHLHLDQLNPGISLDETPFFVPQEATEWPAGYDRRFAGVSSFGLSGTNAHAVLEAAPPVQRSLLADLPEQSYVLPISARSDLALAALVDRYDQLLGDSENTNLIGDLCYTASVRRSHHSLRLAVVGRSKAELAERLQSLSEVERRGLESRTVPRTAFIFSGQGSQWAGMGRELLSQEPVFRGLMQQCDSILRQHTNWSLLDELDADEATSRLADTEIAQPAIFAIQAALLALYQSWGIRPDVVLGHSAGEIAAAYSADIFSLEHALCIVYHRARLMQRATGQGRMAAVGLSAEEAVEAIGGYAGQLSVAAINAATSTVLSGEPAALNEVIATLKGRGVFTRDLGVNYAFHSHQIEPVLDELLESLADIQPRAAVLSMVSSVTGEMVSGEELDAAHWARNMRQPVLFSQAVDRLLDDECQLFLEVGPHPVLGTPISQCLDARGADGTVLASLRQGRPPRDALLRAVSSIYAHGGAVDFAGLYPHRGQCVDLPAYPWQHRRYWIQNVDCTTDNATDNTKERTTTTEPSGNDPMSSQSKPVDLQSHTSRRELVSTFYDQFSANQRQNGNESFLTFAPLLERVPNFSWTLTFYEPDQHPQEWAMIVEAQKQMREMLFRGIDFSAVRAIMDFGCGYGSDVVRFALKYPHVKCDGYTISNAQAEIGNEKIVSQDLQDRVSINVRDSSQDEFPGKYEVIFGLEVSPYIKDKHKLFSNIDRHLNDGGFLVLADFVAHTLSEIGHDETSSYISTQPQWTDLLSRYKLKVVRAIDVSKEISNFLYDPDSDSHLKELGARFGDEHIRRHCASYDNLGRMLQKRLASYQLLLIQKDRYTTKDEIARINDETLGSPQPYAEAVGHANATGASTRCSATSATPCAAVDLQNSLYEIQWRPRDRQSAATGNGTSCRRGSWLVLADETGVGEAVTELLQARGETVINVRRGEVYESLGDGRFRVNDTRAGDFRELLGDALTAEMPDCRGVIHLWGLDSTPTALMSADSLEADRAKACGSLAHAVQALSSVGWQVSPRLWVATRGAQAVNGSAVSSVMQAAEWGMGRTIAAEHAALWGGLIDVDAAGSPIAAAAQLMEEVTHSDGEGQVAFRGGQRYVARLVASRPPASEGSVRLHADGRYLITGGLGDLGLQTARWLAGQGARHVVLMQRSGLPPRAEWGNATGNNRLAGQIAAVQEIEALGATVEIASVDASDEGALRAYLTKPSEFAIRGVIHAAGVAAAAPVLDLDERAMDQVTRPKMMGGWLLHQLLKDAPLDFFVVFSSASSVLNSPMLAGYAAANAFLDGLADYRRGQGQPGLAINWGVWSDVGMAARYQQETGRDLTPPGMQPIPPAQGVQLLGQLLNGTASQVVVVPMDWSKLPGATSPMLVELTGKSPVAPQTPDSVTATPSASPAAMPRGERCDVPSAQSPAVVTKASIVSSPPPAAVSNERAAQVREYLVEQAAKVLEVSRSELDSRQPLNRLGIDSLTAVELRNRIEADMGVSVNVVEFLEGASLEDLATSVVGQLASGPAATETDRLTRARQQLDQMSDETVKALLAEKQR